MCETVNGLKEAVAFFGYTPKAIQTDNGSEFTDRVAIKGGKAKSREWPCLLDSFCESCGIDHKCIRPRTHEHSGKAERLHSVVREKFYRTLRFHSLMDLRRRGKRWKPDTAKRPSYPKYEVSLRSGN